MRFLLCAWLVGWVPLNFAAEALGALPTLEMRGAAAAIELAAHGVAAAICAAAGWMLSSGHGAAPAAVTIAMVSNAAVQIQSLYWSVLPRDIKPGDELPLTVLYLILASAGILYVRSRRVTSG